MHREYKITIKDIGNFLLFKLTELNNIYFYFIFIFDKAK